MRAAIVPLERSAAPALAALMQLYAHDFSEFLPVAINEQGLFAAPDVEKYFGARWRHPFLIKADGLLAGFVIVDEKSRFDNVDAPLDVAEFFVLRGHRGAGVGRRAAEAAFARFQGRWEVRQSARNAPAIAFWRNVISRYTAGAFEESLCDDERWHGPVQRFDNRARATG